MIEASSMPSLTQNSYVACLYRPLGVETGTTVGNCRPVTHYERFLERSPRPVGPPGIVETAFLAQVALS